MLSPFSRPSCSERSMRSKFGSTQYFSTHSLSRYLSKVSSLLRLKWPEKKQTDRLDHGKIGILLAAYQSRSPAPSGPLILIQPSQGGLTCTARLKFGLLATKGFSPCAAA